MSAFKPFSSIRAFVEALTTQAFDDSQIDNAQIDENQIDENQVDENQIKPSEPPIVSIISAFFNVAPAYLQETFHSIANQTWQNYEWLITEDCSTQPETVAFLERLAAQNPKIRILTHPYNKGLGAGRNTAIAQARGKYLYFLDLDDLLEPTCLEKCVLFLEAYPEFSLVNSYSFAFGAEEYWWEHGFDRPSRFIDQNWVTGRLLYRTTDFIELGGFEAQKKVDPYADWERWLRAITHHQKAWTIPEFLDGYRRTTTGMLASFYRATADKEAVTNWIQERYRPFFERQTLPDLTWPELGRSPSFNQNLLEQRFAITNPLRSSHQKVGKRLLCWFSQLSADDIGQVNLQLVSRLRQRGYELTILTTQDTEPDWHSRFYAVTPDIFHLARLLHPGHWLAAVHHLIESRQIDVILISHTYFPYYLVPLLRQEWPHVAFIDYIHTAAPDWPKDNYPRISSQFSDFFDLHIVSCQYLAYYHRQLSSHAFRNKTEKTAEKIAEQAPEQAPEQPLDKLRICYTGADLTQWQPHPLQRRQIREQLNLSIDRVLLFYPARLTAANRPLFLLEMVAKLMARSLPLSLVMVGDGDLSAAVSAHIKQLDLAPVVRLLPSLSPEERVGYYAAADLLVLPSLDSGLSPVLLEAMAMQLPVVAAEAGGRQELVLPGTGFLIPPKPTDSAVNGATDASELEHYLDVLTPLIKSSSLRHHLGQAARQRIMRFFGLDAMIDRLEAIFAEAIDRRPEGAARQLDLTLYTELLLWVQESMAKPSVQPLQAIEADRRAVETLRHERDTFDTQRQAWQKVAQMTQQELNQVQQQLQQALIRIRELEG